MRKIHLTIVSIVFVSVATNAQSDKKDPPPQPPPPKMETVKFTPPKIVKDEKVKKPPPPVVEITKLTPPKIVKDEEIKVQPVVKVKGKLADEFYQRNAEVSEITRQGDIIIIRKKDGVTEKYDMSKKEEEEKFTKQYGESPIPPPPPPPAKISS